MLSLLLALAVHAQAGGFQAPTSRAPLPARIVERPLVVPKGWTELSLTAEREVGRSSLAAEVRHGLAPGHALWVRLPGHVQREGPALGGASWGWQVGLLHREPPNTSVAVELGWSAPAGGLGGPSALAGLSARRQLGPWLVTARAEGTGTWEDARFRTRFLGAADLAIQAGPLVVGAELGAALGSERGGADLRLHGTAQVTRGFEVGIGRTQILAGAGAWRFGADRVERLAGARWGLSATGRW